MGKKIKGFETGGGKKSKGQGGEKIKGHATLYTPAYETLIIKEPFPGIPPCKKSSQ